MLCVVVGKNDPPNSVTMEQLQNSAQQGTVQYVRMLGMFSMHFVCRVLRHFFLYQLLALFMASYSLDWNCTLELVKILFQS